MYLVETDGNSGNVLPAVLEAATQISQLKFSMSSAELPPRAENDKDVYFKSDR